MGNQHDKDLNLDLEPSAPATWLHVYSVTHVLISKTEISMVALIQQFSRLVRFSLS